MKQKLLQLTVLLILLVPVAMVAYAYENPGATAPGGNTGGPITIGTVNQVKLGGLSVGTFNAKGVAQLGNPQCSDGIDNNSNGLIDNNDPGCHTDTVASNTNSYDPKLFSETPGSATLASTTFKQIIRGDNDTFATGDKPLTFGDANNTVTVAAGGNISASSVLQSDTLKNAETNTLCGDEAGVFVFCPPPTSPPVLFIKFSFKQPANFSKQYTVKIKRIIDNSEITFSNSSDSSNPDFNTQVNNIPPGVYEVSSVYTTCPYIPYGYDILHAGNQFIIDKNHVSTQFVVACGEHAYNYSEPCNDGIDNDGDGTADYMNGAVINGVPYSKDAYCGSPGNNEY